MEARDRKRTLRMRWRDWPSWPKLYRFGATHGFKLYIGRVRVR